MLNWKEEIENDKIFNNFLNRMPIEDRQEAKDMIISEMKGGKKHGN